MSSNPTSDSAVNSRVISAIFDTAGAARQAVDDLVAAGIPRQHISQTNEDTAGEPVATTASAGEHKGFWESLRDLFMPDEDRALYAEGLRRGGILVAVHVDEANYNRALDILDTDGAIDIDERGAQWRNEGWTGLDPRTSDAAAGAAAGMPGGRSVSGASPMGASLTADAAAALPAGADAPPAAAGTVTPADPYGIGGGSADRSSLVGQRDDSHGRSRLRSYTLDAVPLAPATGRTSSQAGGGFSDGGAITEHMEVISSDGQTIGTVDHLDGPDRIKLAKNTSPDGKHHIVPFAWIDHVDQHVHLKKSLAEIRADPSTTV